MASHFTPIALDRVCAGFVRLYIFAPVFYVSCDIACDSVPGDPLMIGREQKYLSRFSPEFLTEEMSIGQPREKRDAREHEMFTDRLTRFDDNYGQSVISSSSVQTQE